jgi:RNA polymerase sigma-70 factor (ECF subfamily)
MRSPATSCLLVVDVSPDDRALIDDVIQGDEVASRALYNAYAEHVFRLAYRLTGDYDLASDALQETFVRVFRELAQFRGKAALRTWIHAIAIRATQNVIRAAERHHVRERPLADAHRHSGTSATADPYLAGRIGTAVSSLPNELRLVFVMHDLEDCAHDEIGQALGISIGASRVRLLRARAQLRRMLRPLFEDISS